MNGICLVVRVFDDRSFDELILLAHQLVKTNSVLALLAVKDAQRARLVIAYVADVQAAMGTLRREACQQLGGKGSGTSDLAQGGGENLAQRETVLEIIANQFL